MQAPNRCIQDVYKRQHNIYVDIFSEGLVGTYCHEIWHATEDHITSINYGEFDVVQWAELNPDGFQYIFDPAESILNEGDYTYFGSTKPNDCYFIDGYAKTNEREDRALSLIHISGSSISLFAANSPFPR